MGALCVVATKADMIKWVLARDGKQFVTGYPKSFKDVLGGDTALNTVGEQWKSTRKFVVNGLRTEHLRSLVSVVEDLVLECFDSWETKQIVNVREETKSVSGSITLSLSLFICVSLNPKLCNSVSSSCSFSNLTFLNLLLLLQLAFNVIAQFLLGSRLRSGPVNDALREDFYIVCEGLLAIPIKLPGTKFSKALQVGKD
jgi:steroid 22-alpha-hydroxylase/cytochrome P450 family 90 subfamily A polypeptide 1/brassinosteroid-6-oxidase 2